MRASVTSMLTVHLITELLTSSDRRSLVGQELKKRINASDLEPTFRAVSRTQDTVGIFATDAFGAVTAIWNGSKWVNVRWSAWQYHNTPEPYIQLKGQRWLKSKFLRTNKVLS